MDDETSPPSMFLAEMDEGLCCCFCGRRADEVTKIVESKNARICDVCIRQCNEMITAEEIEN